MKYDVIIIGGSFAGLSAAIYLARARRSVCIVDTGKPRNRFADHAHGFFSHDGSNPRDMIDAARAQALAYPSVTFIEGEAVDAWQEEDGLSVALDGGEVHSCSKLLLAFGVSDVLPAIAGMEQRWGKSVIAPPCNLREGLKGNWVLGRTGRSEAPALWSATVWAVRHRSAGAVGQTRPDG